LSLGDFEDIRGREAASAGGGVAHAVVSGGRKVPSSVLNALIQEVAVASALESA